MMENREPVRGLVLAGGKVRLMQHAEKALFTFRGRPLLTHVLERLRPPVGEIWLKVNRHHQDYRGFDLPLISDQADHAGHDAGAAVDSFAQLPLGSLVDDLEKPGKGLLMAASTRPPSPQPSQSNCQAGATR